MARPGAMRPQWNRNRGRDIYFLRRPEEDERKEIKKIDLQLKRKEMEEHIGGGYFRTIVDEIPPRPQEQEQLKRNDETARGKEANKDAESTASTKSEEAVATHEPGAYSAMTVQDYRDGPI